MSVVTVLAPRLVSTVTREEFNPVSCLKLMFADACGSSRSRIATRRLELEA